MAGVFLSTKKHSVGERVRRSFERVLIIAIEHYLALHIPIIATHCYQRQSIAADDACPHFRMALGWIHTFSGVSCTKHQHCWEAIGNETGLYIRCIGGSSHQRFG